MGYICFVIATIQHKGLRQLWEKDDASKVQAAHVPKIRRILTLLDSAESSLDMNFPGSGLHPLKGDLKGYWSVTVSGNWRIIYQFKDGNAYLVDYTDYH